MNFQYYIIIDAVEFLSILSFVENFFHVITFNFISLPSVRHLA